MHSILLPHLHRSQSGNTIQAPEVREQAIPESAWPLWAKAIAILRRERDKGIGDTVESTIGKVNSAAFKAWYKVTFKKSCGCTERKSKWNALYPYDE